MAGHRLAQGPLQAKRWLNSGLEYIRDQHLNGQARLQLDFKIMIVIYSSNSVTI